MKVLKDESNADIDRQLIIKGLLPFSQKTYWYAKNPPFPIILSCFYKCLTEITSFPRFVCHLAVIFICLFILFLFFFFSFLLFTQTAIKRPSNVNQ